MRHVIGAFVGYVITMLVASGVLYLLATLLEWISL